MYKMDDLVLSVEGSLSIKGNFEEFQEECIEIMRETPLEISSDDDFTALSTLSKQFKRTEGGVLKGAIPLLDFAINQVKKGQEGLEKLEALRKELVSFNGKIEKSCKTWKDEEVERMIKGVWENQDHLKWGEEAEEVKKDLWNFNVFKNSLSSLPTFSSARSIQNKKTIAENLLNEFYEEICQKIEDRKALKIFILSKDLEKDMKYILSKINVRSSLQEGMNFVFEYKEKLLKIQKEEEEKALLKIKKEQEEENLKKEIVQKETEIKVEKKEEIFIKKDSEKIQKSLMSVIFYFEEGINFSKVLREQGFKITSFQDGYKIEGGNK